MGQHTLIKDFFPEREIIVGIAEGNEQCFSRLFHRYRSKVFSIAFHLTRSAFAAEDITQEVFSSIWISRHKLPDVRCLDAYINRVIYNSSITFLKKEKNWKLIISCASMQADAVPSNVEQYIAEKEIRRSIDNAVEQLPTQKRLIFQLSRYEGLNHQQIADELRIAPSTVKNHLVVAVKILRSMLKELPLLMVLIRFSNFF